MFLKPCQQKRKRKPAVIVYPDGREVCDLKTAEGKKIYEQRKSEMWFRQGRRCLLCGKVILRSEATFEHVDGRGNGAFKRDDRISKDGSDYNGVACGTCQFLKGSMSLTKWMEKINGRL